MIFLEEWSRMVLRIDFSIFFKNEFEFCIVLKSGGPEMYVAETFLSGLSKAILKLSVIK